MTLMDDSFEAFVSSFRLQYPWPVFLWKSSVLFDIFSVRLRLYI